MGKKEQPDNKSTATPTVNMNTEEKLEAGLIALLLILGSAAAVSTVPAPSNVYYTGELVEETLTATAENVTVDNYHQDGDTSRVYAKWSIIGKDNGTIVEKHGNNWTRTQINQDGNIKYTKAFQFRPEETGNYTLAVTIAKAEGTYDASADEWNWGEISQIATTKQRVKVVEQGTMSILGQGFDKRMSMMG